MEHKLIIYSLHDAHATCSCEGWNYSLTGAATKEQVTAEHTKHRLEYLRIQLRKECISYAELFELQGLADYIDPDDVELLEAAGVPEEQGEKR